MYVHDGLMRINHLVIIKDFELKDNNSCCCISMSLNESLSKYIIELRLETSQLIRRELAISNSSQPNVSIMLGVRI